MNNKSEKLVILIPCYNEAQNVKNSVASILSSCKKIDMDTELWLIDDGSTDNTREIIQEIIAKNKNCKLVSYDQNKGVGYAVKSGIEAQDENTWVTALPGDNEIVSDCLVDFTKKRHDYDIILGYLNDGKTRTFFRRFCSSAFMRVIHILYGFSYRYFNGLKLYRAKCFKGIDAISTGHAWVPEMLAKAVIRNPDLRITEAPFSMRAREAGKSKAIHPLSIFKSIKEVIKGYRSVSAYRKKITAKGCRENLCG